MAMHGTSPRRFLLSDAVVLVAATAAGLAAVRPYYAGLVDYAGPPYSIMPSTCLLEWCMTGWVCLLVAAPMAIFWTLAILGLRLRRPRERWRRLLRQPGLVACLAPLFVVLARLPGYATMRLRIVLLNTNINIRSPFFVIGERWSERVPWSTDPVVFGFDQALNTLAMIGVAVAASWLLLAASGRWRAEPSWIDRAGRALGVYWIATLPLTGWWDFHAWY